MYVAPMSWVMLYLGVGDIESAFHWLEKSAEARDILLCYLKVGPIYDQIREDPRYGELLQRINLADDESDLTIAHRYAAHSAKACSVASHAGSGGDS